MVNFEAHSLVSRNFVVVGHKVVVVVVVADRTVVVEDCALLEEALLNFVENIGVVVKLVHLVARQDNLVVVLVENLIVVLVENLIVLVGKMVVEYEDNLVVV